MPRRHRALAATCAALSLALAAAGCGSDDVDPGAEAAPTTTTTSAAPTAATPTTSPGSPVAATAHTDVTYVDDPTSQAQVLDLWVPAGADRAVPLVVFVHSGAWKEGDKSQVASKRQPLLDAGFAVASVNYRLSGEATFPAAGQDVKAAVRFLRAHAATYGIDPDRIAAWGESAGGTLAALLGTTGDQTTILDDPDLGEPDVSSAVQAVVDWFGPVDLLTMQAQTDGDDGCDTPFDHDGADSPESRWLGAPLQSVPEVAAQADATTYIPTADALPPFWIAHGDADCEVPYLQSQGLADALTAAGGRPLLTFVDDGRHGDPRFDSGLMAPTIAWLQQVLEPGG